MKYGQFVMKVFQMTIVGGLSLTYSQTLNARTSLTVEVNDTAEIDCEIQQNDDRAMYTAEDITWYNQNQAIPGQMYSTISNTTSVLVLPFVQFADAGDYSCRLDNGVVSTTQIRVGTVPGIANFSCQARNMKEVWCTWDPLPSNLPTTYVFTYKLSHRKKWKDCPDSVTKGPNSCYIEQSLGALHNMRVVATNDLDSKVWQFNIDPDTQSKPDPPEDVKVIAETSNIAAVSWKIPSEWYSPHFTLLYKLQYYSEWEPHIWSEELDADTQLSYTLTSLDAYTCYTIHVATKSQSSSDEYWSDWSTPSVGCTKEAAPEKGLEVNTAGQTLKGGLRNVTIRWQRLTKRQARGEITQYRMTVKDEDDPSKADIIDILDGNATEYTLQGLEVHKSYTVSVIALNTAGPSSPSFIRIVDKTQAICSPCCENGGRCISPNVCECTPNFSGPTCDIDVDECLTNNGGCDHSCINNRGSYSCVCQVGYILAIDAHSCVDADECIESNGGCDHVCDNTAGSFRCSCREGFILDENGSSCTLHNQCASMTCQQHCVNILGRGICYCDLEYYLNDDGVSCNDVNECNDNNGGCNHSCVNTEGSYHCACRDSFTLGEDGKTCQN